MEYVRERIQGSLLSGAEFQDKKADPIIVHPDIRRTLMTIRVYDEAGCAFFCGQRCNLILAHRATDEKQLQTVDNLLGRVMPILKGVLTDKGFDRAVSWHNRSSAVMVKSKNMA